MIKAIVLIVLYLAILLFDNVKSDNFNLIKSNISNLNFDTTVYSQCFDIILPPINGNVLKNNNYNIVFLPDGSITVGTKKGVPKIYNEDNSKGRYGIVVSNFIKSKHCFKALIVKVESIETIYGGLNIEFRGKTEDNIYSEWQEVDLYGKNKIILFPLKCYRYLQYRIRIITSHPKHAPIIKSIFVKGCNWN